MSTTNITAAQIMDKAAALLNDTQKQVFTYEAQLPYFQMALDDLQEEFELNGIPVTELTSTVIEVDAGVTEITPIEGTPPNYPSNLIEIKQLWERQADTENSFLPMNKVNFLPHYLESQQIGQLCNWAWNEQIIKFLAANQDNEVKLDYIKALFPDTDEVNENTVIGIMNSRSYLQYRTAGLCSEFIGENPTRAMSLYNSAVAAGERSMGISIKSQQAVVKRRRPFRQTWKARGTIW